LTNPLVLPAMVGPTGPIPPHYTYNNNRTVLYANDVMALTNRIKISGGVSYIDGSFVYPNNHWNVDNNGTAWRVGPILQVTQNSFLFMDYSTAFVPQNPATVPSSTGPATVYYYPPLTGRQWEAGYKRAVTNRASITAAIYQLTENNVTTPSLDPVKAVEGIKDVSGQQRSRGAELDATYRLAAGWNVLTSYGYTKAVVTKNNSTSSDNVIGSPVAMVPGNSGRIWTTYEIHSGVFRGLGFGGGLYAQTNRRTNIPLYAHPSYFGVIGGYATIDALAYYTIQGWKVSANITNLLDRKYWETASLASAFPGQPISCTIRIQKTFGGESVWRQ
jgi:iron complex outermembrane recepter protein